MCGSHHDGERAAAAWQAHELVVRQHGLTSVEIVDPPMQLPAPTRIWFDPTELTPSAAAATCLVWSEPLTDWEIGFLRSIAGRYRITPKQRGVLDRVIRKCRAFAEFAGADE
jgi:hypothetical protein